MSHIHNIPRQRFLELPTRSDMIITPINGPWIILVSLQLPRYPPGVGIPGHLHNVGGEPRGGVVAADHLGDGVQALLHVPRLSLQPLTRQLPELHLVT